ARCGSDPPLAQRLALLLTKLTLNALYLEEIAPVSSPCRKTDCLFEATRDTCPHFTLSLLFPLKILHPVADRALPRGVRATVQRKPEEVHEFGSNRNAAQTFLILHQPMVDITLDHRQQVLIFLVDQVKLHACECRMVSQIWIGI